MIGYFFNILRIIIPGDALINWDVSPEIFSLGPLSIRWYGLLFACSFLIGYQIMLKIFRKEGKSENDLNDLVMYMILGTVIGARLGHCFFYNPAYYFSNPLEIIKVWKGGLASHGAAIGILTSLYLYVKRKPQIKYLWLIDRIVIPTALGGFFIRLGNLFNSEIIGMPAEVPWAFVFTSVDAVPRHPAQLYESIAYLLIFVFLIWYYYKLNGDIKPGYFLGLFLILVFTFRFFVEFIKKNQTNFEEGMFINIGQILSIPLILVGIVLVALSFKKSLPVKSQTA